MVNSVREDGFLADAGTLSHHWDTVYEKNAVQRFIS